MEMRESEGSDLIGCWRGYVRCSTWLVHASERLPHARAVAPAVHPHLHMLTSSSPHRSTQTSPGRRGILHDMTFDPREFDQRHDSKVSASSPDNPAPELVSSANSTLRAPSPVEDLNTLIARIATKRRGSDDSLKTAYTAEDTIPESAYRSRPDLRSNLSPQPTSITASAPTDSESDEEDLIATFTDY
jgi:hypothetical protein